MNEDTSIKEQLDRAYDEEQRKRIRTMILFSIAVFAFGFVLGVSYGRVF